MTDIEKLKLISDLVIKTKPPMSEDDISEFLSDGGGGNFDDCFYRGVNTGEAYLAESIREVLKS